MTTRREKAKAQKPQFNKQLEAVNAEEPKVKVNSKSRKEKLSNYMIDVSKYVLTGVVITSLFNDVTDKPARLPDRHIYCSSIAYNWISINRKKERKLTMGVYLAAIVIGVPGIIFLLYCLTPRGKRWMRANGLL